MRLLKGLALASALGAWAVIVIGGYVTATNSGLACPNVVDCGPASEPGLAAIELTHRLAGWVEGSLVLALFVLVVWRYRAWRPVRALSILSLVLIAVQASLGMLTVYAGFEASGWYPALVTAHLGVATAFLAVTIINAVTVYRGTPPTTGVPTAQSPKVESANAME